MRKSATLFLVTLASLPTLAACDGEIPTDAAPAPAPPAPFGSIEVTIRTSGEDIDPDGYILAVDGEHHETGSPNAIATLPDLDLGSHTIWLMGVAENCELSGENPRWITVTAGQVARASFDVACSG